MKNDMKLKNIFQKRLVDARNMRELSQDELAKRAKLQATAISHFENGRRKPSFDNLKRLADALEVTSDYLMGRTNDINIIMRDDPIWHHFENLTAEERDIARGFIKSLAKHNKKRERRQ